MDALIFQRIIELFAVIGVVAVLWVLIFVLPFRQKKEKAPATHEIASIRAAASAIFGIEYYGEGEVSVSDIQRWLREYADRLQHEAERNTQSDAKVIRIRDGKRIR